MKKIGIGLIRDQDDNKLQNDHTKKQQFQQPEYNKKERHVEGTDPFCFLLHAFKEFIAIHKSSRV